jgi:hypothetical protein
VPENAAVKAADEIRPSGINGSNIASQRLRETLRKSLTDEEKIKFSHRYRRLAAGEEVVFTGIADGTVEVVI